jgi:hypothetical protein
MPRVRALQQVLCGEADMLEILPDDVPISQPRFLQPKSDSSDSSKMVR